MSNYPEIKWSESRFTLCCAMAVVLICLSATTSPALDGIADVRGYRQGGRAGATSYATETLWEMYALDQRVELHSSTLFQIRYSFQRENLWSKFAENTSKSRRVTQGPFLMLSYRGERFRTGLTGQGLYKETFVPDVYTRTDNNLTSSAWARYEFNKLELEARYLITKNERSQGPTLNETRNTSLGFVANYEISANDRLKYSLDNTNNKGITLDTESKYLSNILQYYGNHRFNENRGRFNIATTLSRFDQSIELSSKGSRRYNLPIWGGFSLDDTPQDHDPLEPDPVSEPMLYDNDVVAATAVNVGSSAPAVREFGGDYRNIILDFGEPTVMDSIALHIDIQLNFPGLIQWLVYVSNDPEGRLWGQPLGPEIVTVNYRESELGRQGWEVRFAEPVTQRRVKLVNVKFGVTEPDIFITEMEVFSEFDEVKNDQKNTLSRFRLNGDIRYDILPDLEINFTTDIYEQRDQGGLRDLSGAVNQAGSVWRPNDWNLTGYYQVTRLEGISQYKTDVHAQFLSLARKFTSKIDARIAWRRTDDNSTSLDYTTNELTLNFTWRIAPDLYFHQQIGRGFRTDHFTAEESDSWVHTATIRANPIKTLSLNLQRVDRWVSEYLGSGFTNYNNTELVTQWAILPRVGFHSQLVYQVREDKSDWGARNQISWNPIPGGTLETSFSLIDYRDTRIDIVQQSAGVNLTWKARSNIRMEFGSEYVQITLRGEKNTPVNLYLRGRLNF